MKQLWTKYRRILQPITICNATDGNLYGTSRKHTELHIELLIVLPEANNTRTYVSMKTEEELCNIIFSNSSRVCLGARKTQLQL